MNESPKQQIAFFEQEVNEILGKPPRYLVRWGVTLYAILFGLVIFLSVTITYPEYGRFEAEVIPLNNAKYAVLESADQIIDLNVGDGSNVKKDQLLFNTSTGNANAGIDGTIRFLKPISSGYSNTEKDTIIQINPQKQDYDLIVKVPSHFLNKVAVGQRLSFPIDSKIVEGRVESIPTAPDKEGYYHVQARSESNTTFISSKGNVYVDVLIDNKKIFNKILNL